MKQRARMTTHEIVALVAALAAAGGGLFLSFSYDPAWLNRAGAVVIIIGVLLAASRLSEVLELKVATFVETNFDGTYDEVVAEIQRQPGVRFTAEAEERARPIVREEMKRKLNEALAEWK